MVTYDAANQLTAMNANGTVTNFTYDDWGRNTGKTQGTASATYTYSCGDKLATAVSYLPGEALVGTWDYDGLGKRRSEVSWFSGQPSQTVRFRWSGWEESGEYAAGTGGQYFGAKQTGYVPGMAAYAGADPATADWRFNLNDHLGSPRQMLGQDKSAKARLDFSPYGELMRSAGLPLTVGYTGHRWDPAIGQYFAPFRYYSPQTVRWNMRDPLGFVQGPNVYAYVAGNPARYIDRKGLCPGCVVAIVAGLLVAGAGYYALGKFFDRVTEHSDLNKVRTRGTQHEDNVDVLVNNAHKEYVSTGQSLGKDSKGLGGMPLGVPSPDVVTTPVQETVGCVVDYAVDKLADIWSESDGSDGYDGSGINPGGE